MISRAQNWVDKHVPFNATKTYDGYRTDSSGFVSMCWQLPTPGLVLSKFYTVSFQLVIYTDLAPGDAMKCETKEVLLFYGWASTDMKTYIGVELATSAEGTVKKVIPFPYFNNNLCYMPIRFNSVC